MAFRFVAAAFLAAITASAAHAETVRTDRGGNILARYHQIQQMNATGAGYELSGRACLSSCTMFLGLDDVCIHADTVFGFHAPSVFFRSMTDREFQATTGLIASHYPDPIARQFMDSWRHDQRLTRVTGAEIIATTDIREC